ncbi:UNVERIFIED_CONTAM: Retrovirus-related Pol polyprotein from transposon TNT 1-94, partial [Sesamum angustifolium]
MVSTRPDIAYAVSCLSRFMSNPGTIHWEALKWLFRYLNGSNNSGIKFSKCSEVGNLNFKTLLLFSTTEAEYIAITEAFKEAIWLEGCSHLGPGVLLAVMITKIRHPWIWSKVEIVKVLAQICSWPNHLLGGLRPTGLVLLLPNPTTDPSFCPISCPFFPRLFTSVLITLDECTICHAFM